MQIECKAKSLLYLLCRDAAYLIQRYRLLIIRQNNLLLHQVPTILRTPLFMRFELFISKKLRLYRTGSAESSAFTLKIATFGIILAIIIMIAAISIVSGFKTTIINKISGLEPHIELRAGDYSPTAANVDSIVFTNDLKIILKKYDNKIKSASLVAESPCIIKTKEDFNGMIMKGVSQDFDSTFLSAGIISGKFDISRNNILISKSIAEKIKVMTGDKINLFFIKDNKIKQRRLTISGIFNTDFEDFDKAFIIGNIKVVQSVNSWDENTGTSIDIFCNDLTEAETIRADIASDLFELLYRQNSKKVYQLSTITENNSTYFAWLDLLDANIVVILILMTLVSCFSLIAGLLIVVLNRINMIGILKSLGASNRSIRAIFIYLAEKIIFKAMIIGNAIGLALILLQQQFHIVHLDPATYYMDYVPVEINSWLLVLNAGIIIISALALIGPSYIITSISPAKTIRFE